MAPSHYLIHCWFTISKGNFTGTDLYIINQNSFNNCKIQSYSYTSQGSMSDSVKSSPISAMYMSLNWAIISLDNGLSSVQCQAIILPNDDFSSTTPQEQTPMQKLSKLTNFQWQIAFEFIIYNFANILSKRRWANDAMSSTTFVTLFSDYINKCRTIRL